MTRKPAFWILLAVLSIASTIAAYTFFPQAFPIVSLDIRMDREAALHEAARIAETQRLGPAGYRQAASFELDEAVQTFVELEGGGKEAFTRLMRERFYSPYRWRVRHFKEGETNETEIRFEPDGRPFGFREQVSEDAPGTTVTAQEARRRAEHAASSFWRADFSRYTLVEQSQERKPKGRVDHRLVYERQDLTVGEGRYRLRLVVSGDRLAELTYFIKIPEAFERRYEQMRSANNAIGAGSTIAMLVLYGVGGIAFGLFTLLRHRWVLWRQPVVWGFGIALLQMLDTPFNRWPLLWMSYDTALSTRTFAAEQIAFATAGFVGLGVVFSLSFMAAESLTRRAFPWHPQFWRLWSRDAAPSVQALGRTVAGILLVAVFFAYEVALYFFATRVLGWWTPSEALFHPDVLAAYLPWFSAVAPSLQAGFWEECLFRAVPIAGAALIGDRIGQRRLMIVLAFAVQAVVFGAGHAPYPTQPSYARAVELIIPSIVFGIVYLRWGLLPAIVLHFAFDVVWFALPLFVSTAAGVWIDRTLVVLFTLTPLWIVLAARARTGRWIELPGALRNAAWHPPEAPAMPVVEQAERGAAMPRTVRRALPAIGVGAVVIWAAATAFRSDVPGIGIGRSAAADIGRRAIADAGGRLTADWRVMPTVDSARGDAHRFVLETSGRDVYLQLLGTYLSAPRWRVRAVTFEGDVAERAEEWGVDLDGSGGVRMVHHRLPEGRAGAALTESDARETALAFIAQRFGLTREKVREVSLKPSRLAARTDWEATFAETDARGLSQGELRNTVRIAGDTVAGADRFVYIPEEWVRRSRSEATVGLVMSIIGGLALAALLVAEAVVAVVSWSRRAFAVRLFLGFLGLQMVMRAVNSVNQWPVLTSAFSTAQPYGLQRVLALVVLAVGATVPSAVLALIVGAAPIAVRRSRMSAAEMLAIGGGLGAAAAAAIALGARLGAKGAPAWPNVSGADTWAPAVAAALSLLSTYLLWTVGVLVVVMAADQITRGWTRWRVPVGALILLVGISLGAIGSSGGPVTWIVTGTVIGLLTLAAYVAVLRYDPALLPIATAVLVLASAVRMIALRSFPGAFAGALAGIALVMGVTWWWASALANRSGITTSSDARVSPALE